MLILLIFVDIIVYMLTIYVAKPPYREDLSELTIRHNPRLLYDVNVRGGVGDFLFEWE
jgi:hypothetical protein